MMPEPTYEIYRVVKIKITEDNWTSLITDLSYYEEVPLETLRDLHVDQHIGNWVEVVRYLPGGPSPTARIVRTHE